MGLLLPFIECLFLADSAASRLPLYGRCRDAMLDTLLGPAQDFSSAAPPPSNH